MQELLEGGWIRREDQRSRGGQFGGIDYALCTPTSITQADKKRVAKGLKQRGMEYATYRWRTAARVLADEEIKRVCLDILTEIETERADAVGDGERAVELVSEKIKRLAKGERP